MKFAFSTSVLMFTVMALGPFAFLYAWLQYSKKLRKEAYPIRNRFTLASLALVSLAVVLWPICWVSIPKSYSAAMHYGDTWVNFVVMPVCLVAAVLSLLGRPRVILPIVIACWGTVVFWAVSLPGD
jgi:hypothetical protein